MTDTEIFKGCQAGNRLAWEEFVRRFQQRIFSLAGIYTRNPDDTRDLAQEIFIKLYRNLGQCTDPAFFVPWMITLARNTAIDYYRQSWRRHEIATDDTVLASNESATPSPEANVEMASRRNILRQAINSLNTVCREVIMMKDIQELSLREISEILQIPEGTVKSRLNRARIELTQAVLNLCGKEVCHAKF